MTFVVKGIVTEKLYMKLSSNNFSKGFIIAFEELSKSISEPIFIAAELSYRFNLASSSAEYDAGDNERSYLLSINL